MLNKSLLIQDRDTLIHNIQNNIKKTYSLKEDKNFIDKFISVDNQLF